MGRDLTNLNIKDTYEGLVQISGSQLTDGTGSLIPSVEATASFAVSASHAVQADSATSATTAVSASHAVQADNATTADSATSASFAETAVSASWISYSASAFAEMYVDTANNSVSLYRPDGTSSTATIYSSSYAENANTANSATSASYALTASYAENAGTPTLQDVLDAGNEASGSIVLKEVGGTEGIKIDALGASGPQILSTRGNSIMYLGVDQTGQRDLITLGANASVGFYGGTSANFNTPYSWFKDKGWISGSLAVQQAFTASGLIYPTTDGTSGQVIGTDGLGNLSFITAGGGGGGDTSGLVSGSGFDSFVSQYYSTTDAIADDSGSIAIGNNALATGSGTTNTIVIGNNANSKENAPNNVIIGANAYMNEPNRDNSVVIGAGAHGYQEGVAVGSNAFTIYQAVAIGRDAYTNDNYGVAVGAGARTNNNGGIAIGSGSLQDGDGSIAIGKGAHATAQGDVVINNSYANVYTYDSSSNQTTLLGNVESNGYTLTQGIYSGSVVDNITDIYTASPRVEHIISLTQAEYNAISASADPNTLYQITDAPASMITASAVGSDITFTKEDGSTFQVSVSGGGGSAFPFTGSADISGSLNVVGFIDSIGTTYGPNGTDFRNMLIGSGSGVSITTGIRNVCVGSPYTTWGAQLDSAGSFLTQGSNNTLVGNGTGCRMTTGNNNAFFGQLSGGGTTTGQSNTGVGYGGLRDNNGSYNTGIGHWAGYGASGQNGVMVGYRTGFGNSGWRNIIIGANAVGQGASLTTHDKLVIGQDLTATDNLIYGFHGPDTTAGDRFLNINGLINAKQYSADPTGAGVQAGSIYFNTTTNKLKCYDGTTWNDLF